MSWFKRQTERRSLAQNGDERRVRTEGLWLKCEGCRQIIWKKDLEANLNVCPKCGQHFRIDAAARLATAVRRWRLRAATIPSLRSSDPLQFVDSKPYSRAAARPCSAATNLDDALISGRRQTGRAPGPDLRHGAEVHRRQHGLASWARRSRAPSSGRIEQTHAADHRFRLGRRAHAGRRGQPDADGQDLGRADAPGRSAHALTSASSPTRPPAASPPASPCWAISISPNPAR